MNEDRMKQLAEALARLQAAKAAATKAAQSRAG